MRECLEIALWAERRFYPGVLMEPCGVACYASCDACLAVHLPFGSVVNALFAYFRLIGHVDSIEIYRDFLHRFEMPKFSYFERGRGKASR